jgi:plastocyanin
MTRKLLVLPLFALALALAACGDDNKSSDTSSATTDQQTTQATTETTPSTGGGSKLTVEADPSGALKFTKDRLEAKAGTVTIEMDNPSPVPHAIAVEGNGVDKDGEVVQKGGKSVVTVDLKPGDYEFYCPVPGHKEGGMKGTLTVK